MSEFTQSWFMLYSHPRLEPNAWIYRQPAVNLQPEIYVVIHPHNSVTMKISECDHSWWLDVDMSESHVADSNACTRWANQGTDMISAYPVPYSSYMMRQVHVAQADRWHASDMRPDTRGIVICLHINTEPQCKPNNAWIKSRTVVLWRDIIMANDGQLIKQQSCVYG